MSTPTSIPESKNFLSPLGFKFSLMRAPNLTYNVQRINLPGISLGSVEFPNPFSIVPTGGKVRYEDLTLSFLVDEDLNNYLEIYNWMVGIGFPKEFPQHKALSDQPKNTGRGLTSDMNLIILTSSMTPNISIDFLDAFPINISDLSFSTTDSSVNYIEASVTFKYQRHEISVL